MAANSTSSSSLPGWCSTFGVVSACMPRCMSSVASPPSSRIMFGAPPSDHSKMRWVYSQYSVRISPLTANTGMPAAATAAAAWSWVEIDVARCPAHVGAERRERLDQHRGLNRHVQRAGNARAAQRLLRPVLLARRHQAGHFGFGDRELLAAPFGEADVLDDIVGVRSFVLGRCAHDSPSGAPCGLGLRRWIGRLRPPLGACRSGRALGAAQ